MSVVNLVLHMGPVGKGVLLILLFFSVFSWAIILYKLRLFRRVDRQSLEFLRLFRESKNLSFTYEESKRFKGSPLASVFQEGFRELSYLIKSNPPSPSPGGSSPSPKAPEASLTSDKLDSLGRSLRQTSTREISQLERYLIFLATTGSVAPFIGLFGTVWGIMDAFAGIGAAGSPNLGAVAPGIAEALVNTAAGLAAAIPAVIAYNYFINRIKAMATGMDLFSLEFLQLVDRIISRR
mgnify:CR=1 FL=1